MISGSTLSSIIAISPFDSFLQIFNQNPYFIGIMMLCLNIGGKFIGLEITKQQEQFFQHPWIRRILIFVAIFVATRNVWVAFWLMLVAILFIGYLFNEKSALCLFGTNGNEGSTCSASVPPTEQLTPEENEILARLIAKSKRLQPIQPTNDLRLILDENNINNISHNYIYKANLKLLNM